MIVYGKPSCSYCNKAVALLKQQEIGYEYVDLTQDEDALKMVKEQGFKTVPQIYTENGTHIGGYDDLVLFLDTF